PGSRGRADGAREPLYGLVGALRTDGRPPGRFPAVRRAPGGLCLCVELHPGGMSGSGTRNEVVRSDPSHFEVEGNDRWYAWSTMFPADYPSNNTWQVFTQWQYWSSTDGYVELY